MDVQTTKKLNSATDLQRIQKNAQRKQMYWNVWPKGGKTWQRRKINKYRSRGFENWNEKFFGLFWFKMTDNYQNIYKLGHIVGKNIYNKIMHTSVKDINNYQ